MTRLPWRFREAEEYRYFPVPTRIVGIVLTIAHLNHDPTDNRDENLRALCQWCHLDHDRRFHLGNARRTRARKSGQQWLCAEEVHPCDLIAQIDRCDREIAEIRQRPDVAAGLAPAWLVTLGIEDWEAEKRILLAKLVAKAQSSSQAAKGATT